ncbi:MAG: GPR endopeptidase [Ruminococcus sp.]|jgi:spore protease|nr:GPR endopeptidase [Ruminococcus sp.]
MSRLYRTDIAVELIDEDAHPLPSGVNRNVREKKATKVTEITIKDRQAASKIGKPQGRYVTIETHRLSAESDVFNEQVSDIAEEIEKLTLCRDKSVLIVGLGNSDITPDSLGPRVASQILVTRHLHNEKLPPSLRIHTLNSISAVTPGVLGQTGIEAAESVQAIVSMINPGCVFVVDALACADISRLGSTIQLTDTGISPGSGVQNRRKELSAVTLGVPVYAFGVPTVIDMHTIAENITGRTPDNHLPNMMVTPRDVDKIVERSARLLAYAINKATQPSLSIEDITALK